MFISWKKCKELVRSVYPDAQVHRSDGYSYYYVNAGKLHYNPISKYCMSPKNAWKDAAKLVRANL